MIRYVQRFQQNHRSYQCLYRGFECLVQKRINNLNLTLYWIYSLTLDIYTTWTSFILCKLLRKKQSYVLSNFALINRVFSERELWPTATLTGAWLCSHLQIDLIPKWLHKLINLNRYNNSCAFCTITFHDIVLATQKSRSICTVLFSMYGKFCGQIWLTVPMLWKKTLFKVDGGLIQSVHIANVHA